MKSEFRVKFTTTDGSLVMNRLSDSDIYTSKWWSENAKIAFVEEVLKRSACEKGVRVLSYTFNKETGIEAIVEWL